MRSLSIVCFQRTLGTAASGHNQTYVALLQFSPKRSHQTKPICYAAAFSVAQNARYVMSGRRCSRPRWRLARSVSGPSGSTNERVLTANSSRSRPPKFTLAMTGLKCGADVARRRNRSEEIYKVGAQRLVTPGTKKLIEWPLFQKSNWRFRPTPAQPLRDTATGHSTAINARRSATESPRPHAAAAIAES
jgi:hypothetical protein